MGVLTLTLLTWAFYGQKNPAVKRDSELCWMLLYYKLGGGVNQITSCKPHG